MSREVTLVASGDLRETAHRLGWPAQAGLERHVGAAFARHGASVRRALPVDTGHGPRLHAPARATPVADQVSVLGTGPAPATAATAVTVGCSPVRAG